jgi:hypothetical protein
MHLKDQVVQRERWYHCHLGHQLNTSVDQEQLHQHTDTDTDTHAPQNEPHSQMEHLLKNVLFCLCV